jgi:hypothetical protein
MLIWYSVKIMIVLPPTSDSNRKYGVKILLITSLVILAFVANVTDQNHTNLIGNTSIMATTGAIIGLISRNLEKRPNEDRSALYIIFNDFRITKFSLISASSFIYAASAGACLGASTGFIGQALAIMITVNKSDEIAYGMAKLMVSNRLMYALSALALVFAIRMSIETYVLLFRVAQKYLNTPSDENE